jgi:hypothetical protein
MKNTFAYSSSADGNTLLPFRFGFCPMSLLVEVSGGNGDGKTSERNKEKSKEAMSDDDVPEASAFKTSQGSMNHRYHLWGRKDVFEQKHLIDRHSISSSSLNGSISTQFWFEPPMMLFGDKVTNTYNKTKVMMMMNFNEKILF